MIAGWRSVIVEAGSVPAESDVVINESLVVYHKFDPIANGLVLVVVTALEVNLMKVLGGESPEPKIGTVVVPGGNTTSGYIPEPKYPERLVGVIVNPYIYPPVNDVTVAPLRRIVVTGIENEVLGANVNTDPEEE